MEVREEPSLNNGLAVGSHLAQEIGDDLLFAVVTRIKDHEVTVGKLEDDAEVGIPKLCYGGYGNVSVSIVGLFKRRQSGDSLGIDNNAERTVSVYAESTLGIAAGEHNVYDLIVIIISSGVGLVHHVGGVERISCLCKSCKVCVVDLLGGVEREYLVCALTNVCTAVKSGKCGKIGANSSLNSADVSCADKVGEATALNYVIEDLVEDIAGSCIGSLGPCDEAEAVLVNCDTVL